MGHINAYASARGGWPSLFLRRSDPSLSIGNATVGPYFVGLMRWAVGLVARNVVGSDNSEPDKPTGTGNRGTPNPSVWMYANDRRLLVAT